MDFAKSKLTAQGQISVPAEVRQVKDAIRKMSARDMRAVDTNIVVRLIVRDESK
jgi:bifunctional DNA-binding transcriptional regulator/antitoxin component of YhaV-PrlF toxin-antitoxin module